MNEYHTPVLLKESVDFLITEKNGIYFDATLGFGGHSEEILKRISEESLLISADVDSKAFNFTKKKFKEEKRIKIYNFNFNQIDIISKIESIDSYNGIIADLGVSSYQLDATEAGFTYRKETKLDLRMDKRKIISAYDIVNSFSEEDLQKIFYEYGEEKNSKRIAKEIVRKRGVNKIETTKDLSDIISELTPPKYLIKTLSRIFQALRIYVNEELSNLKLFIEKSVSVLKKSGRLVIISYHSLEDRIVKESFKYEELDCICPKDFPVCRCNKEQRLKILTRKPVIPSPEEIKINRRARSAKMRVAERV
jgi:16S rRNA (cytosine1402-N4)-methyltransferase